MFFSEEWGGSGLKERGSLLVSYKGRTITFLSGRGGLENFPKKFLHSKNCWKRSFKGNNREEKWSKCCLLIRFCVSLKTNPCTRNCTPSCQPKVEKNLHVPEFPNHQPPPHHTPQKINGPPLIVRLVYLTFSVRPPCHSHWMMSRLELMEMKLFQLCYFGLVVETRRRLNRHTYHLHLLFPSAYLTGKPEKKN